MMTRETDAVIAQKVMLLLSQRKRPARIAAETGFPKLAVARVTRLLSSPAALAEVLSGQRGITEAFKLAFPAPETAPPCDPTPPQGSVIPPRPLPCDPTPPPEKRHNDNLAKLAKRRMITEAEAEAGRTLRKLAKGWTYPGLEPSKDLMAAWPAPLRVLWQALRPADTETARRRLPTSSLAVWNIAVDSHTPGCLTRFNRPPESGSEIEAIRIGLSALAARIAAGLPEPEQKPEKANPAEKLRKIGLAIELIERSGITVDQTVIETGLSRNCIIRLRQIRTRRPDLLPLVRQGQMTVNAASLVAEEVREGIAA